MFLREFMGRLFQAEYVIGFTYWIAQVKINLVKNWPMSSHGIFGEENEQKSWACTLDKPV